MIRFLAHLAGWHTNACRGDLRCWRLGPVIANRRGWYRFLKGPNQ